MHEIESISLFSLLHPLLGSSMLTRYILHKGSVPHLPRMPKTLHNAWFKCAKPCFIVGYVLLNYINDILRKF